MKAVRVHARMEDRVARTMRVRPKHSFLTPEKLLELRLPGTLPLPMEDVVELRAFMQAMVNRAGVGNVRYGEPATRKQYLTRLRKELKAYVKTGNGESLFNIAVYAWLETIRPQHRRQYFDTSAESVTRGEMGGNVA